MLTKDAVRNFVGECLADEDPSNAALATDAVWLHLHGVCPTLPPHLEQVAAMAHYRFKGYWRTFRLQLPDGHQGSFIADDSQDALKVLRACFQNATLIDP